MAAALPAVPPVSLTHHTRCGRQPASPASHARSSNAIKFTPRGGAVTLGLSVTSVRTLTDDERAAEAAEVEAARAAAAPAGGAGAAAPPSASSVSEAALLLDPSVGADGVPVSHAGVARYLRLTPDPAAKYRVSLPPGMKATRYCFVKTVAVSDTGVVRASAAGQAGLRLEGGDGASVESTPRSQ